MGTPSVTVNQLLIGFVLVAVAILAIAAAQGIGEQLGAGLVERLVP